MSPPLSGHSLTVTSIRFSPDDRYILTASRDRSWQLYARSEDGESYIRQAFVPKAHARIIWDCAWGADCSFFATAARDKHVKVWQAVNGDAASWKVVSSISLPEAATAIDLARYEDMSVFATTYLLTQCTNNRFSRRHVMAVGTETGSIQIYTSTSAGSEWTLTYEADSQ